MYAAHFNLREPPFSIAPDPAFLYMSSRHQEALGHLLYGTGQYGGFVQLTGEVGTGKTTIVRTLLSQKLDNVDVAMVHNPRQNELEFVASICDELGVAYEKPPTSIKSLVDALNEHLLKTHAAGHRTVLIIDEAQQLDPKVLEQVRLLTNLETDKAKLLRIMLIGQPELIELLARQDLRQLASRITARYHLTPLSVVETMQYIIHRLQMAGGASDVFTDAAMRRVHRYAQGIPRQINIICDRALLGAYAKGFRTVGPEIIDHAAAEALGLGSKPSAGLVRDRLLALRKRLPAGIPLRWIGGALTVAALVITGVLLSEKLDQRAHTPPAASSAKPAHTIVTTTTIRAGVDALRATAQPLPRTTAAPVAPSTAISAEAAHITTIAIGTLRATALPVPAATQTPATPPAASSMAAPRKTTIDIETDYLRASAKPLLTPITWSSGENPCRAPSLQRPECYKDNDLWIELLPFKGEGLPELPPLQNTPVHKTASPPPAVTNPKSKPITSGDLHGKAIHSRPNKITSNSLQRSQAPEPAQIRRISPPPVVVIPMMDEPLHGTIAEGRSQASINSISTSEWAQSPGQRISRLPHPPIVTLPVAPTARPDAASLQ